MNYKLEMLNNEENFKFEYWSYMKNHLKSLLTSLLLGFLFLHSIKLYSEPDEYSFLVLNNPINSGFGAIFSSALSALDLYDRGNYSGIKIDLNSGMYVDAQREANWWEYFFEPINIGNEEAPHFVFSQHDVAVLVNKGIAMRRERGYELIQKYIHLKPHMQNKINLVVDTKFKDNFVIGIHHRGTDKHLEAPIVPYDVILFNVNWWMANLPKDVKVSIFVATDDQNFLDYICEIYPNLVVYNPFVRSRNENPVHYNDHFYKSNYQKGEEAILDCILLSKCHLLFFPQASAFSMTSLKFNPSLPAIPLRG